MRRWPVEAIGLSLEKLLKDGKCEEVFSYARKIAPIVAKHFGNGKTGGVATFMGVFSPEGLVNLLQRPAGEMNPYAEGKYWNLSAEKAMRSFRLQKPNSYSADRNPDLWQWGGAFALDGIWGPRFSFSGWPEKVDIVFGVHCNHHCGVISDERAVEVFMEHGYEFGQELTGMHRHMIEVCIAT